MKKLLTVIIPSFNRFKYLKNAIESVNQQGLKEIDIIVINDGSTEEKYYDKKFPKNVQKIDLKINNKILNGFSSDAIRNIGIDLADTKYIAFLDDDDCWLEGKIETQIDFMKKNNYKISCTEGLIGSGIYDNKKKYKNYLNEYYFDVIAEKFKEAKFYKKKYEQFYFPKEFNFEFICVQNCIATSSVVVETEIIKKVGMFDKRLPNGISDYDCWKKILRYTNSGFIDQPYFYYDKNHGYGQNYKLEII